MKFSCNVAIAFPIKSFYNFFRLLESALNYGIIDNSSKYNLNFYNSLMLLLENWYRYPSEIVRYSLIILIELLIFY
jgi:hypothetical protein